MTPVIELHRATKSYPGKRGAFDLTFEVRKGEIFGYLGPNGAGKTTTIRMMLGLARPTSGSVKLFGHKPGSRHLRGGQIGYLPGEPGYYENMTGNRVLALYASLTGRPAKLTDWLCERLEFTAADRARRIKTYSKGTRQKLGLVQALQHDPDLAILDEPTTGLDPLVQRELGDVLRDFRERGCTIFFSSHVLSEVYGLCDRIGALVNGRLALDGTVADLIADADRLLWLRPHEEFRDIPDHAPILHHADFLRAEDGWLVYRVPAHHSAVILDELHTLRPSDFRLEADVESSFMKLYESHPA